MDIAIGPIDQRELPALLALLDRCGLPRAGVAEHLPTAVVARARGQVVGSAALELYGTAALLRSVAVDGRLRGRGLGRRLAANVLERARTRGVERVYLLTETAPEFFARLGFQPVERAAVPEAVRQSVEFAGACPASAQVMERQL
jgi:amino-acid N-acetyltransferase